MNVLALLEGLPQWVYYVSIFAPAVAAVAALGAAIGSVISAGQTKKSVRAALLTDLVKYRTSPDMQDARNALRMSSSSRRFAA